MLEEASQGGWPVVVALCDVDDFKQVNDTCGHLVGDQVLRQVAQTLQAQVRSGDLVGRLGGEEFLLALPGLGRERAAAVLERIGAAVRELPPPAPGCGPVTVSIGAVIYEGEEPPDLGRLLARADEAMYCAKRSGKDCVVMASAKAGGQGPMG